MDVLPIKFCDNYLHQVLSWLEHQLKGDHQTFLTSKEKEKVNYDTWVGAQVKHINCVPNFCHNDELSLSWCDIVKCY